MKHNWGSCYGSNANLSVRKSITVRVWRGEEKTERRRKWLESWLSG
jgi:hypothetical protein